MAGRVSSHSVACYLLTTCTKPRCPSRCGCGCRAHLKRDGTWWSWVEHVRIILQTRAFVRIFQKNAHSGQCRRRPCGAGRTCRGLNRGLPCTGKPTACLSKCQKCVCCGDPTCTMASAVAVVACCCGVLVALGLLKAVRYTLGCLRAKQQYKKFPVPGPPLPASLLGKYNATSSSNHAAFRATAAAPSAVGDHAAASPGSGPKGLAMHIGAAERVHAAAAEHSCCELLPHRALWPAAAAVLKEFQHLHVAQCWHAQAIQQTPCHPG